MGRRKHRRSKPLPKNTPTIKEKISEELDLPLSTMPGISTIELAGNRQAVVGGCKGVLEYDEGVIKLNLGKSIVRFVGNDLAINTFQYEQVVISGSILTVDFL